MCLSHLTCLTVSPVSLSIPVPLLHTSLTLLPVYVLICLTLCIYLSAFLSVFLLVFLVVSPYLFLSQLSACLCSYLSDSLLTHLSY